MSIEYAINIDPDELLCLLEYISVHNIYTESRQIAKTILHKHSFGAVPDPAEFTKYCAEYKILVEKYPWTKAEEDRLAELTELLHEAANEPGNSECKRIARNCLGMK